MFSFLVKLHYVHLFLGLISTFHRADHISIHHSIPQKNTVDRKSADVSHPEQ